MRGTRSGQGLITPAFSAGSARQVAYTPAITWPGNTVATVTAQYLRTPGLLSIWGTFQETAGTANALITIPLPTGFTASYPGGALSVIVGLLNRQGAIALAGLCVTNGATSMTVTTAGVIQDWGFYAQIPLSS